MEVKPTLACGLQKSVETLWKDKHSCDFTVVVDDISFQCHRFILNLCSGFFQGLFRSQMKECLENQVKVGGMTASTFDIIINSLYRGVDGLTLDNVFDVWSATEQLQIKYLTEECEKFAIENISVDNCFSILRHAKMYSAGKVESHILAFVIEHFEQVRNMEDILELPFDYLYRVIESDYLKASSEDVVVETVLKWVNYDYNSSDSTSSCEELDDRNLLDIDNTTNEKLDEAITKDEKFDEAITIDEKLDEAITTNEKLDKAITNNEKFDEAINNNEKLDEAITNDKELDDSITLSHLDDKNTEFDANSSNTRVSQGNNKTIEKNDDDNNHTKETSTICTRESQNGISDNQSTLPGAKICQTGSLSECVKNSEKSNPAKVISEDCEQVCHNDNLAEIQSEREERKQHLFKLFSVCRLCLISSPCLDNLFHNGVLLSCKEACSLVTEAMMYKLCVGRRHAPWPEAAVHRMASDMKHVVVFLSDEKFMAHNLSTGVVKEFANTPEDFRDYKTITVFDNVMYLCYVNKDNSRTLSMFAKEKSWEVVNEMATRGDSQLLAHGNHIFSFPHYINQRYAYYCNCLYGHNREWININCLTIKNHGHFVVAFEQYILMFYTKRYADYVLCYNTKTEETLKRPTSMPGTSHGMTSFSHLGDMFLLQRDGSLWKIYSTDTVPVDFKSISKIWNKDLDLRGSVVYRKELFVFYHEAQPTQLSVEINMESVHDLFSNIKMVSVKSSSLCLPMVLPESWFIRYIL